MLQLKKRHRLTLVCSNCKRRKSRCDRGKPACGNCVRLGNKDTCEYFPSSVKMEDIGDFNPESTKQECVQQRKWEFVKTKNTTSVDLTTGKIIVHGKMSATYMASPLATNSVQHRDLYFELFNLFSDVAIKKTVKQIVGTGAGSQDGNSLPNSVKPLISFDGPNNDDKLSPPLFSKHKRIHKSLFDKFSQHRYELKKQFTISDIDNLVDSYLLDQVIYMQNVWPHFKKYVLPLVPIYDPDVLLNDIENFYSDYKMKGKLSVKNNDYITFATILLTIRLVQLSINFDKSTVTNFKYNKILKLNTEAYPTVVNCCILQSKLLRKCTLPQLQCLILVRFHNWCSPMDGDGEWLQHSNILQGTIYASCMEMGINWMCIRCPERFDFEKLRNGNEKLSAYSDAKGEGEGEINNEEMIKLYQSIWAVVLHWDRKLGMITGQEPIIGKSMKCGTVKAAGTWHVDMLATDNLKWKLVNTVNEMQDEFNLEEARLTIQDLRKKIESLSRNCSLDFEQELTIQLLELSVAHACYVGPLNDGVTFDYTEAFTELVERIIHLTKIFVNYFHSFPTVSHQYTRFYTNRIVEIAIYRVCNIMPSIILRMSNIPKALSMKPIVVKFYHNLCSLYFNELGYDYYQVFKRLFKTKVMYKIIDKSSEPLRMMLNYLIGEIALANDKQMLNIELMRLIYEEFEAIKCSDHDVTEIWGRIMPPANDEESIDIYQLFSEAVFDENQYNSYNLFTSFYDCTSNKITENTSIASTDSITNNPILCPIPSKKIDSRFNLLEGMLDPMDFVSWLDDIPLPSMEQTNHQ
ncbi:HHL287Cp [Eremothecium sinecaudum]|uniref:Oleate activated transcription factor 3 n=1 Tax=Eremothecium sinecaudum TaxID=45286 RepID=A0A109V085_9SACH|nr:HHL287Cp [Eremothecium sinecaudum]AMD22483.1 HHL287Cp [Eremothecium sinecaudum]